MPSRPTYVLESVRALPDTSQQQYELIFRARDGVTQRLVASIETVDDTSVIQYDPVDPVFSMRDGDDPRPVSHLIGAFDQARRGDLSGYHRRSSALRHDAAGDFPS